MYSKVKMYAYKEDMIFDHIFQPIVSIALTIMGFLLIKPRIYTIQHIFKYYSLIYKITCELYQITFLIHLSL